MKKLQSSPLTSRWFLLGSPEPLDVKHSATELPDNATKDEVRAHLRAQAPTENVFANLWFEDVVDLVWAQKNNDKSAKRLAEYKVMADRPAPSSRINDRNKRRRL